MSNVPPLLPVLQLLSTMLLLAQNAVTARFNVESPTLINLGFDWEIAGDANRNGTVEVKFRGSGTTWKDTLPLPRIGGEKIYRLRETSSTQCPTGSPAAFSI
jgi:hypothetical protein